MFVGSIPIFDQEKILNCLVDSIPILAGKKGTQKANHGKCRMP
jgi:hypothetical protein